MNVEAFLATTLNSQDVILGFCSRRSYGSQKCFSMRNISGFGFPQFILEGLFFYSFLPSLAYVFRKYCEPGKQLTKG